MKDRLFQIWFSLRCGISSREFPQLLERYGSPYAIFEADEEEIERFSCSDRLKSALANKELDESYRILSYCEHNHIGLAFWSDKEYPSSLRVLRDPPVLLYYKGELPDFDSHLCISVVGTRKMSEYGKRMAYKIGYELGAVNAVVVSGMALGIDSVAAAGALAAGGKTVAVLGSGVDVVYPPAHKRFMDEIILRGGAVVSEFAPGTEPMGRNFPIRNRIISGLGQGTAVIEADMHSGALITAKTALLQGKDLYAVPGNVGDENTSGTNQLIHDGAIVTLGGRDILENYEFLYRNTLDMARLGKAERNSDHDDAFLDKLGVYSRVVKGYVKPKEQSEPTAPKQRAQAAKPKAQTVKRETAVGDDSEKILLTLTEKQRNIFSALPLDRAVPVDHITREGFALSDVIAAMTILEIKGLVVSLPGGLYSRK
ncbi:MAG: DNA-protecting protein DprA [Ruminococcaceae bacterium]|nr:DNA-protecting protein DprA [Oscillospiraceae bacterium]